MSEHFVRTTDDLLELLDSMLVEKQDTWWDRFFSDRTVACPFFVDAPDENLVDWVGHGLIAPGRALELGCGNGRNATWLASNGFRVDAVDFSAEAISWARERAVATGTAVRFECSSLFDARLDEGGYDLVYDSGCLHHLPPHRRPAYTELVRRVLRPGGRYGLVCFGPEGGSGYTDREVYEKRGLGGGLGYSEAQLRALWDQGPFSVQVLRSMAARGPQDPTFGRDFLWAVLATRADA